MSVKPGQSLLDIAFFESGFLNPSVCQDMIQAVDRDQAAGPVKNDSPCQRPGSGSKEHPLDRKACMFCQEATERQYRLGGNRREYAFNGEKKKHSEVPII